MPQNSIQSSKLELRQLTSCKMTIVWLSVTNWLGWLTGIWYLNPQSSPSSFYKFVSWSHPATLIPTLVTLTATAIWLDFILHYITSVEANLVRRLLTMSLTALGLVIMFYLRLTYAWKIKKLCTLVNTLKKYATSYPFHSSSVRHPIENSEKMLLSAVLLLQIVSAICITYAVSTRREMNLHESWFEPLSNLQYTVLFLVFAALSNYIMAFVAFATIIIITKYSFKVFTDFCDRLESTIVAEELNGSKYFVANVDIPVLHPETTGYRKLKSSKDSIKTALLEQFDNMVEIFHLYDQVMGYILLGVVVGNITLFLQRLNDMLTWSTVPVVIAFDAFSLSSQMLQLGTIILLLGHNIQGQIITRKLQLRKVLSQMPKTILKDGLSDLVELLEFWEWKFSAAGFFVIDRSLMTGIFYIILSCTVVVVQIQVPESFNKD